MTVNTTFTAGNILTAAQMNNFGRGLMATPAKGETTDSTITAEELMLTYTFTAVNNRNYSIVYFEPSISGTSAGTLTSRIRINNITDTVLNQSFAIIPTATTTNCMTQLIYTATASGSFTIVASLQASAGTVTATRSGTKFSQLYALDIGTGY